MEWMMEQSRNSCETPSRNRTTVYLQEELGLCLPPALGVTVTLKPADPIAFLADCLYKYRALNPVCVTSPVKTRLEEQKIPAMLLPFTADDRDKAEFSTFCKKSDFLKSTDFNFIVHSDVIPVCNMIGDLFDDNDIG